MIYICGPSSKDIGNRLGTISISNDSTIYHEIINNLLKNDSLILK